MSDTPRPPEVPEDWICGTCVKCQRPTWYPPGAESAAKDRGVQFLVVCSAPCALKAVKFWERVEKARGGGGGCGE